MSDTVSSPDMNMPIPVVGVDPGPQWATDINSCLNILDSHNHAAGYGVPINPGGININSDLSFNGNNATSLRSTRFSPQSSPLALPTDLGCLYESGVDLYYNDGNGNQVRITQSGGVAGSPGSIGGLSSPASATYVSGNQTFVWQSAANTPANMDGASYILRNLTANSFGLTLNPPVAMGSNFSITLPTLPASQKIMTLDNSGNMAAPYVVDNSTIEISSNTIQVKAKGIGYAQLANTNIAFSSPFTQSTTSSSFVALATVSLTTTTTGRPIWVGLLPGGSGSDSFIRGGSSGGSSVIWALGIGGFTNLSSPDVVFNFADNSAPTNQLTLPVTMIFTVSNQAAATYTFTLYGKATSTSTTVNVTNAYLMAYEI